MGQLIDERKGMSKPNGAALRAASDDFRELIDAVEDYATFALTPEGIIASWNRGAQRVVGFRGHEVVGRPFAELVATNDEGRPSIDAFLADASRLGHATAELFLSRRDGRKVCTHLSFDAVEDAQGGLRAFVVVGRDLSAHNASDESLRQSERHFRLLVESVQDTAIFMMSPEGVVNSWNRGAQRVKGFRAPEAVGSSMDRFFPAERVAEGLTKQMLAQASSAGSATYEGWLIRGGTTPFWGVVTLSAVEDENGRLIGFANVARDLSDKHVVDAAVRASEERLRLLIDSLQDYGVFMITPDAKVAGWNTGAKRLKGYEEEEILGESIKRFFPTRTVEDGTIDELLARAEREGRAEYEGWVVRKDGSTFWATVILAAIRDREGKLRGFSNIARDLTERVRAERVQTFFAQASSLLSGTLEVTETMHRLARLVTAELAEWCVVSVANGGFIVPRAVAHIDADKERRLAAAVKPVAREASPGDDVTRVVEGGDTVVESDVTDAERFLSRSLVGLDADTLSELGMRARICAPLRARGRILGAITVVSSNVYGPRETALVEEIARRAAVALDNAQLYEDAQRAIRLREEVLAVVSHDLRTPLSSIVMGAGHLREQAGSDDAEARTKVLARIERSAQTMERMIFDLLDFASIAEGRLMIDVAAHRISDVVHDVVDMVRGLAESRSIELVDLTRDVETVVMLDRARIGQVLSNLIGNAIKFTPDGGSVTVAVQDDDTVVSVAVTDTGPGMSAHEVARVFDRYWKAAAGGRNGVGLGLAIAKGIIEAHGGVIEAESAPGKGSTFRFAIPKTAPKT